MDTRMNSQSAILSMKKQIKFLKTKLSTSAFLKGKILDTPEVSIAELDKTLQASYSRLEELNRELILEKDSHRKLKAEYDYIVRRKTEGNAEFPEIQSKLHQLFKENFQLKDQTVEIENAKEYAYLEQVKKKAPNVYFLMTKIKMIEEHNKLLINAISQLDNTRCDLRNEYSNITQGLTLEEKAKQKIKALENALKQVDVSIRRLRETLARGKQRVYELDSDRNHRELVELQGIYSELSSQLEASSNEIMKLYNKIKETDEEIKAENEKSKSLEPGELNKALRTKLKELEDQIAETDRQLIEKDKAKQRFQTNINNLKHLLSPPKKTDRYVSLALLSPKSTESSVGCRTPAPIQEKPKKTARTISAMTSPQHSTRSQKNERDRLIAMLSKGIPRNNSKEIKSALHEIGIPGESLARKVIELNRGEFLAKYYADKNKPNKID
ncbi:unnamed protein product [Blepharisma stoltei]|uniref:Uncharacterized protein n=1 Tax=Blepharisma stoltei TaxID=1481888 RepID=A0AAU9JUC1_9CILI|nr:unnamed protein product [Blepharisma stoltei]